MEKFNEIYNLNIDTFNNPEYKTWYTKAKIDLEKNLWKQKIRNSKKTPIIVCNYVSNY